MTRRTAVFAPFPLAGLCLVLGCSSETPRDASGGSTGAGSAGTAGATTSGGQNNAGTTAASAGQAPGGAGGAASGAGGGGGNGPIATAGASGSGGSATAAEPAVPSAGCNEPASIEPGHFATSMLLGRSVSVRLPTDYDPARAYPIIFVWKGCSAPGVTSYGLETVAGNDAIIAQGDFPPGSDCYDTGDGAQYVDLPLFDALLTQIEDNYCADKAHVFSVGFSSGAWLTQLLACQRGDVLRGIGTIAGAFKPAFTKGAATCVGSGLSAFMVSDLDDHTNPFYDEDKDGDSVEVAVNHWLVANGCSEKTWTMTAGVPAPPDPSVCRAYAGCGDKPVELCLTMGKGHAAQETLSMPGFWGMFQQSLPK